MLSRSSEKTRSMLRSSMRFVALCAIILFFADGLVIADEKASDRALKPISFDKVSTILKAKCYRCHGGKSKKADLNLTTTAGITAGGESGPILDRKSPRESLLYEYVDSGEMPPEDEGSLTAEEKATILGWLTSGALMNSGSAETVVEVAINQHNALYVLRLRCIVCHGPRKQEAMLDLSSKASLLTGGKSGPAMVLGKPDDSLLIKKIHAGAMPPKRKLAALSIKPVPPDELELLRKWIAAGAPEKTIVPDVATRASDEQVTDEDRDFWSFKPPRRPRIPKIRDANRIGNPIDAFILRGLEKNKLSLAHSADRHTLIRRATFDLIGLPPSPEEIASFVADEDPLAYEKLIDRLLASPHYGERWGRLWLDVAGYSDSEGVQNSDVVRPHAYRYRDYVIRAFNRDKPYSKFVQQQIAGDELADYENAKTITEEMVENLVATGFLRMAADGSYAGITNFVPDRLELIDDEIEVFSSAILGLTIKCARCHSHKFDPIPTRDYYRLLATFKGALDEHDWLINVRQSGDPGLHDRYLPFVTDKERKAWEAGGKKAANQPLIRALWDRGIPTPTYILRRGDYLSPGKLVGPGVPTVLTDGKTPFEIKPPWKGSKKTGRRLALARWLTQPDHPLTSRVMINRIWKHHFGKGIVATLDNFGKAGARPTHPELLDWLAREFVRQGWSIKQMHRLMMTSATYRQSSIVTPKHETHDPDNDFYSRMPLRRMEGEVLRDALLSVSGRLDLRQFGRADRISARSDGLVTSVSTNNSWRRTIYVQQRRTQILTILENFDLPQMSPNCIDRTESIVAPQALQLSNNKMIFDLAGEMADRIIADVGDNVDLQITRAYELATGTSPGSREHELLRESMAAIASRWARELPGKRYVVKAKIHLWIRESEPDRIFENDLISVWSSSSADRARRWGVIEFNVPKLHRKKFIGVRLELGSLDNHPIKQSVALIPPGIERITWNGFKANKSTQVAPLKVLGRVDTTAGEQAIEGYMAGQTAQEADLQAILETAKSTGRITLVLKADEDGSAYRRDWDDGVHGQSRGRPPQLVFFYGEPDEKEARRLALRNICHAILNSAAFIYID